MDSIDTMTLADIVQIISGLGVTGVLIVGIWLMIKGKILPRAYVDEMKLHAETQTKLLGQEIGKTIVEGTENAVKEGVVAAVKELNGGS